MAHILEIRSCCGCGETEDKRDVLVALIGRTYICDDCVALMAAIVAKQSPQKARIRFVDYLVEMLKEPIEVVAKWKEIAVARETTLSESKDVK